MITFLGLVFIAAGVLFAWWANKRAKRGPATKGKDTGSPGVYEISQRTKRIRAGVIVIAASVIAIAVLAALKYHHYPPDMTRTWLDDTVIRWQNGETQATSLFGGHPLPTMTPTY